MTTETATIIPEGEVMARQTAQAKRLREAREEIARLVQKMCEAQDRKGLERIGIDPKRARELIGGANFTSRDFANMLGISPLTLSGWLLPDGASARREISDTATILLELRLRDAKEWIKER